VLKGACAAFDGSKFKAVNNLYRNFTKGQIGSRIAHLEEGVALQPATLCLQQSSGR
jgi:hypothetical protein